MNCENCGHPAAEHRESTAAGRHKITTHFCHAWTGQGDWCWCQDYTPAREPADAQE